MVAGPSLLTRHRARHGPVRHEDGITFRADVPILPARALSRVVLPQLGGPSSSVRRPGSSTPLMPSSTLNLRWEGRTIRSACRVHCTQTHHMQDGSILAYDNAMYNDKGVVSHLPEQSTPVCGGNAHLDSSCMTSQHQESVCLALLCSAPEFLQLWISVMSCSTEVQRQYLHSQCTFAIRQNQSSQAFCVEEPCPDEYKWAVNASDGLRPMALQTMCSLHCLLSHEPVQP